MYSILIADDEAIVREEIKCLLDYTAIGFTICGESSNGEDAYRKILSLHPDVVFLDICMPGMSGLDVARKTRSHGFCGKILIISNYSNFEYAREAIRYGAQDYLTKPVNVDELEKILTTFKDHFDKERLTTNTTWHYRRKAHDSIVKDVLLGDADLSQLNLSDMHFSAAIYQVVIYEKYSHNASDASYEFADLLRVTNQDNSSFDHITLQYNDVLLLKGQFAIQKFNEFLERYNRKKRPQKNSPLDSLFITYGRCVNSLAEVPRSYEEAYQLKHRRFFCDKEQHTMGYKALPAFANNVPIITDELVKDYSTKLLNYIQSFNRNKMAETLKELQDLFYNSSDSIQNIKLFLIDLYLRIHEQMLHLYPGNQIPFSRNTDVIRSIENTFFLYEILLFFTGQFEIIMSAIGTSTRDSVLDDILYYIAHNYTGNITLENIAPLFGYNSSYLGKIFHQKMGLNFNSYIDHMRIEHAKKLLLKEDTKVYSIAEKVGYRNVDYFHIKFKKYVGQSPAEFRKKNKPTVTTD